MESKTPLDTSVPYTLHNRNWIFQMEKSRKSTDWASSCLGLARDVSELPPSFWSISTWKRLQAGIYGHSPWANQRMPHAHSAGSRGSPGFLSLFLVSFMHYTLKSHWIITRNHFGVLSSLLVNAVSWERGDLVWVSSGCRRPKTRSLSSCTNVLTTRQLNNRRTSVA